MKISTFLAVVAFIALVAFTNIAVAEPHCRPCPYSCYDLGLGDRDCSEISSSRGVCCVDLTQKGLRLAQEQERVLSQNKGGGGGGGNDRCPAGFHPSEQKCSQNDRRRGCKDIRTPSGLGCRNM